MSCEAIKADCFETASSFIRTIPSVWEFHPISIWLVDYNHRWGFAPRLEDSYLFVIFIIFFLIFSVKLSFFVFHEEKQADSNDDGEKRGDSKPNF